MGYSLARRLRLGRNLQQRHRLRGILGFVQSRPLEICSRGKFRRGDLPYRLHSRLVLDHLSCQQTFALCISVRHRCDLSRPTGLQQMEAPRKAVVLACIVSAGHPRSRTLFRYARSDAFIGNPRRTRHQGALRRGQRLVDRAFRISRTRFCSRLLGSGPEHIGCFVLRKTPAVEAAARPLAGFRPGKRP